MTPSKAEGTKRSARRAWNFGVRGRLLLAFLAISAFAVLVAAAGIYSFRQVGGRLDVIDTRVPPTLAALELSRSAERIIAAAPALVVAADRRRRDEVKAELAAEVERLNHGLVELKDQRAQILPLQRTEPIVAALAESIGKLDDLVARRLESTERVGTLRRGVFQSSAEVRRLLAPWHEVIDGEISAQIEALQRASPNERGDDALASMVRQQRLIQTAQRQVSVTADVLTEASSTEQVQRLTVLDFQLGLALSDLEQTAAGLDPKLGRLILEQVAKLRAYAEGANSILAARRQELALISEGRKLLAETANLSTQLTAAVDQVGNIAKLDIRAAIHDALTMQQFSTRLLVTLVGLSLLTSVLIVWLYVGRSIVRRLTALSEGMLTIAGGNVRTRFAVDGTDEIAAMGRAVEVFRKNTLERDELLAEKARAAERLEAEVKLRTRELTEALEQQTATAEILRVISTSPTDAQRVFQTIVENSVSLCGGLFANVFRFDGELLHFAASHNVGPSYVDLLREKYPMRPDSSQVSGRVILSNSVIRLEDANADPDYDQRFPAARGWRRMLGIPMLREGSAVGVVVVGWAEAGPIPAAQEELLKTFADQAVIAIENARLFDEVQARTRELSEALEQQTAASEILRTIASSPGDAQPVFETVAKSVTRLCDVRFCQVFRFDGKLIRFAAHHGLSPEAVEDIRGTYPLVPGPESAAARAILKGAVAQIPDVHTDPDYRRRRFADLMDFRSVVAVPMLKNSRPIGAIAMARSEIGYFPERQIELLRTFADQAVIAIENTRLFDEIQSKTRELEIADKYKSHFLASASHDLRQPLHALNLFITQLQAEVDPTERERLVTRVEAAVASMNELFESLLDMSKLEAGILEPHFTDFPIQRVLRRIESTFTDAARQKGVRLAVVPSSAWIRSDLILFERILMNFVSNAVRYTVRGGIVVGCRRRDGTLRIDVCDSGPGIPEEQQKSIFGEYYRLAAAEPDRGGLGLGLAIVDRLGRLLSHKVELASRPGQGSRFSVYAPLAAEQRAAAEPPAVSALPDPARGKFVLVIDDDPLVLEAMSGILRGWGCAVLAAESEDAALSMLAARKQQPDLIISDYRLASGKTGIEAIERLRSKFDASIPAFLISGDTAPERLRDARESGFHLLHKPVAPMRLRAVLNQLLRPSAPHSARPAAE